MHGSGAERRRRRVRVLTFNVRMLPFFSARYDRFPDGETTVPLRRWSVVRARVNPLGELGVSLSDHLAVEAELELESVAPTDSTSTAERFAIQARNLARLSSEGMRISFGTDGNNPWAPHLEMEDMVAAGMSPADVLVAATRNAAELAGFTEMGTVEAGKSADLVVLEANPLDNFTNTRRISAVYLRGEEVDRDPLSAPSTSSGSQ